MKLHRNQIISICLAFPLLLLTAGCGSKAGSSYPSVSDLDKAEKVTLKIAIPYETNKALNTVANAFMAAYPNVTVELPYIEDYDTNAVQLFKENQLDMILQKDVFFQEENGKTTDDYFYNFAADSELLFSDTTPDITNNYRHIRTAADGTEITYQYSYPIGGETRGVFVNKTLLDQYDLSVPTNYSELLACCKVLKEQGLIPIQGGGDTAAYGLGLAPAANSVTHDTAALEEMRSVAPGVSRRFQDVLDKLHTLATKRYFDYKATEEAGYFLLTNELGQAESFLGLQTDPQTFELIKPENNYGYAAFLPYLSSTETVIQSLIEEYGLDTELTFICSPLNDAGSNSPVYITPYYGICANKNSRYLDWSREFVNFLFQEEQNKRYAEAASIIPNTLDAIQHTADQYHVDAKTDITMCGQIRFSDEYNGFTPLAYALKETLKSSAKKYMVDLDRDANGNPRYQLDEQGREYLYMGNGETTVYRSYVGEEDPMTPGFAFCTLDYYLDLLENKFADYRME